MLTPDTPGHVIGRRAPATLLLPPDADRVSRQHFRLTPVGAGWVLEDLASRWGTLLNGVRLEANRSLPVAHGDFIRILPWTFLFSSTPPGVLGIETQNDDMNQTMVQTVSVNAGPVLAPDLAALLLESVAAIHAAEAEAQLAKIVLDAARRGTGLANAALLRPLSGGRIEVIATSHAAGTAPADVFSRSLLAVAAKGQTAELVRDASSAAGGIESSIIRMKITAALCAPLMLGGTPAAYVYLDARQPDSVSGRPMPLTVRPGASVFLTALARMASLCMANLRRAAVELRQAKVDAELRAAAEVQSRFLPPVEAQFGQLMTAGRSTPGQSVGGDFFELIPLSDSRLAVAVGDVSGKGLPAALLMAVAHAYFQANLSASASSPPESPAALLTSTIHSFNAYISQRKPDTRFITLWLGVIDTKTRQLTYVDAGHGLAALWHCGTITRLAEGGGPPIGTVTGAVYDTAVVPIQPGDRLMLISDGVVEQPLGSSEQMFGADSAFDLLHSKTSPSELIQRLMAALLQVAGGPLLYDDSTIVCVDWTASPS